MQKQQVFFHTILKTLGVISLAMGQHYNNTEPVIEELQKNYVYSLL